MSTQYGQSPPHCVLEVQILLHLLASVEMPPTTFFNSSFVRISVAPKLATFKFSFFILNKNLLFNNLQLYSFKYRGLLPAFTAGYTERKYFKSAMLYISGNWLPLTKKVGVN
jgi:hypothetical protein